MGIKAYILCLGYERMDSNFMVHNATHVTADNPNVMHEWVDVPIWAVLVDHPQRKILFDLGGHIPDAERDNKFPWTAAPDETIENQLSLIGMTAKDIDTVIVSHMHMDHFGSAPRFTHCEMYVPKEDWVNGLIAVHRTADGSQCEDYVPECINAPIKRIHPVAIGEDQELVEGVKIITLPGHSPNLLGMVLHLENAGTLLFPSDAIYNREIYGPPAKMAGLCYDNVRFRESVEKVRRLQKKYDATIMFSHDAEMYSGYKKIPEYYD